MPPLLAEVTFFLQLFGLVTPLFFQFVADKLLKPESVRSSVSAKL
jgi:ABC-type bacteriocin/lantibiotic exporter with double-glycine peptidase domain